MKEAGLLETRVPFTPAAGTPGLAMPSTPAGKVPDSSKTAAGDADVLESAIEVAQEMEDIQSVKEEMLTVEDIEQQASNVSLFPLDLVQRGLVEIESCSGSSSSDSSLRVPTWRNYNYLHTQRAQQNLKLSVV